MHHKEDVESISIEIGSSFEKVVPGMKSPFSRFFGSGEKDEDPELSRGRYHQEQIEQVEID